MSDGLASGVAPIAPARHGTRAVAPAPAETGLGPTVVALLSLLVATAAGVTASLDLSVVVLALVHGGGLIPAAVVPGLALGAVSGVAAVVVVALRSRSAFGVRMLTGVLAIGGLLPLLLLWAFLSQPYAEPVTEARGGVSGGAAFLVASLVFLPYLGAAIAELVVRWHAAVRSRLALGSALVLATYASAGAVLVSAVAR